MSYINKVFWSQLRNDRRVEELLSKNGVEFSGERKDEKTQRLPMAWSSILQVSVYLAT